MNGEDTESIPGLEDPAGGTEGRDDPGLGSGERIGRYLVLSRLRMGGTGVVYAAYDPSLDRRIAIKVLRRRAAGSEVGRAALRDEARALARLQHANVVSIYDVGEHEGRVFLAMELVEGQTLAEWLEAGDRSWREIVGVFLAAGRGLAAAHGQELLHGDFKPSNVMIGDDGSVRVMDFGLARFLGRSSGGSTSEGGRSAGPRGTRGFIAPEILAGGPGDARSDLYSFCIALSRILFGTGEGAEPNRPLGGATGLRGARGRPPRSIRRLLERGLAEDPEDRYSTMDELLAPLSSMRRHRPQLLVAALVLAIVQGVLWLPVWKSGVSAEAPCEVRSRFPEEVWGPERAAAVERQFGSVAPEGGPWIAASVIGALDDYTRSWADVRLEACRSLEEDPETAQLYDLTMDCLDQRLSEVQAVVAVLLAADRDTVDYSIDLAFSLRGLARCSDRAELSNLDLPPLGPVKAKEVERLRQQIESAFVELYMVEAVDVEVGQELLAEARELGHPLMVARALQLLARQFLTLDQMDEASRRGVEALTAAVAAGDRPLQALLYSSLAQVESSKGGDFAQAEVWERLADSALEPLGDAHHGVRFDVERGLSLVDYEKGDLAGAEARLRRAIALGEEIWGPDSPRLRVPLSDLAVAIGDGKERIGEGIGYLERSLAIGVKALGPDSALLLPARVNLSNQLVLWGDLDKAERLARDAVRTAAASSTYASSPYPVLQLAEVLVAHDRPEEALGLLETALDLARESFGEAHRVPIEILTTRGFAELQMLEHSRARSTFNRALGLARQLPESHLSGLPARLGLGYAELAADRDQAALGIFERLASDVTSDGSTVAPWVTVMVRGGLGEALLRLGRAEEARLSLEAAIEEEPPGGAPLLLARPRFALTRLIAGEEPETALALAESARAGLSDAGSPDGFRLRSEVDAWLRDHGASSARGSAGSARPNPPRASRDPARR